MLIKFATPVILAIAFVLLPEKIWNRILEGVLFFLVYFKNMVVSLFLRLGFGNAKALTLELCKLEGTLSKGHIGSECKLSEYKFYTGLVLQMIEYGRRWGISVRKVLRGIREGLTKDYRFERKLFSELRGGIVQFIVVSAVNWIFALMVMELVNIPIGFSVASIMIFLQVSGIFLFVLIYIIRKKKSFSIYEKYLSTLIVMRALVEVGLGIDKTLQQTSVDEILGSSDLAFETVRHRLEHAIDSWKRRGTNVKTELDDLIAESWFLMEQRFESFLKSLNVLKFLILAVFYMGSYFVYLFHLTSLFLVE
ncbi:MAG: hypothetical protein KAQ98_10870 [Bacteriovoracaceae bacterium]|nr:hypothetical protein [Bacteriovoracaceae bacterium]